MSTNLAAKLFLHQESTIEHDFAVSARTSIARKTASAPLKQLVQEGRISKGSCLNFGKGRCDHDSNLLRETAGHCQDYDYTYCRSDIIGKHFKTCFAVYVQNTLPPQSRNVVWSQLASVTAKDGVCYVACRSDKDRGVKGQPFEDGFITSINTFQRTYKAGELLAEAKQYFAYCRELKASQSGYRIVECRHRPFGDENVLQLF